MSIGNSLSTMGTRVGQPSWVDISQRETMNKNKLKAFFWLFVTVTILAFHGSAVVARMGYLGCRSIIPRAARVLRYPLRITLNIDPFIELKWRLEFWA